MPNNQTPAGFDALGLPDFVLRKLSKHGFHTPTPIQQRAIPVLMEGRDVVGIAQTGTGKTLAFALPMIACLERGDLGLILAPTRELAHQIEEVYRKLGVHSTLIVGGAPMRMQVQALKSAPDVIVATPGRLLDHIEQRTIDLRCVTMLVLDEADRMLDMGFLPSIKRIIADTLDDRQTMLFSATMPTEIANLAKQYMYEPEWVQVSRSGETIDEIEQEMIVVAKDKKIAVLKSILRDYRGTILVFSRTRHGARRLARLVRDQGHSAAEIHADRTLIQRRAALKGFQEGRYRVLVATDIAARGIDVKNIGMVLNFDVPNSPEDYVHRIGRTGRAGQSGIAVTIATPDQHEEVRGIEKFIKAQIPMSDRSEGGFAAVQPKPRARGGRRKSGTVWRSPRRGRAS